MGTVYLAEDTQLFGKKWAVKELLDTFTNPTERAQAIQQFEHEARILVSLDHPNLPKIVAYFEEKGKYYLVMDYIDGQNLQHILDSTSGFLPERQVLAWTEELCDVLSYLHSLTPPVIFRDLKPANIMLTKRGEIKLIDFGIARLFDPRKATDTLKMGTPPYAAPEQYYGRGQTSARSDIYGLGATLYHLLTKTVPVESGHRVVPQPTDLVSPQRLNPQISDATEKVILKAMATDAGQRYRSADEMKQALTRRPSVAPPMAFAYRRVASFACAGALGGEIMAYLPSLVLGGAATSLRGVMTIGMLVFGALGAVIGALVARGIDVQDADFLPKAAVTLTATFVLGVLAVACLGSAWLHGSLVVILFLGLLANGSGALLGTWATERILR